MHKIQSKPLTRESFEIEQIPYEEQEEMESMLAALEDIEEEE